MRRKAQSISEYLVLVTLIAAALTAMQIYFRRSIQAVVKIAADEIGGQKEGVANENLNMVWLEKEVTDITGNVDSTETETKLLGASVRRTVDEAMTQQGGTTYGVTLQR